MIVIRMNILFLLVVLVYLVLKFCSWTRQTSPFSNPQFFHNFQSNHNNGHYLYWQFHNSSSCFGALSCSQMWGKFRALGEIPTHGVQLSTPTHFSTIIACFQTIRWMWIQRVNWGMHGRTIILTSFLGSLPTMPGNLSEETNIIHAAIIFNMLRLLHAVITKRIQTQHNIRTIVMYSDF